MEVDYLERRKVITMKVSYVGGAWGCDDKGLNQAPLWSWEGLADPSSSNPGVCSLWKLLHYFTHTISKLKKKFKYRQYK